MESPLPFHQKIDPFELWNFANTSAGTTMVSDQLVYANNYILINGLNAELTFMFYLGPQYAVHEVMLTHLNGPDYGRPHFYLASLKPDTAQAGWQIPSQLIQDYPGTEPPTWISMKLEDYYAAAVQRNQMTAIVIRADGAIGAPFTAKNADTDFGAFSINGGPGIYAMRILIDAKNGASAGYKAGFSAFGIHRITGLGFM